MLGRAHRHVGDRAVTNNLADHFSRPIDLVEGDGCRVVDRDGKRYLDFLAGWCVGNVGWKRKEVIEEIRTEAARGLYVPPVFRLRQQEEFAALLVEHAPGKRLKRVFRCTSGSEAVEFAVKCARAATGKATIVSIDGVYHGHTYGAASVGDACSPGMAPGVPAMAKLPMPNPYRVRDPAEIVRDFDRRARERHDIAAFLSEPVFSNAGAIIPPATFYPAIERICREHDILFIMDEVATGFGRCGAFFASELWGLEPDILCLGKGLTGGYGTLGATVVSEDVFQRSTKIPQYSTFGWLPLDLAAARANVNVILKERLWKRARDVGSHLLGLLKRFAEYPFVGEVRGIGLLLGIEVVKEKRTKVPDIGRAEKIVEACAAKGLLLETAGHTLFITPPLTLTKAEAEEGAQLLGEVLERT